MEKEKKKSYSKPKLLMAYGTLKDITSIVTCPCITKCFQICVLEDFPDSPGNPCPRNE
jgi:hypothetical protein